ncbi:DUF58 domain-containing protein [Alteromonas oceanisediminis]|uniref:DUF58 domain-containing protein n=1 Tax=Alteromonas oceanisediminis TaxID=2836180 RepID=UPI001BD9D19E|nr:DUF58 domain-containing protein [Alteromonas oceanisediminis]MBT0587519.1 DUF58 domain-containing protein [Alteromonas oceanisediminis]
MSASVSPQQIAQWLEQYKTSGTTLSLAELLQYRHHSALVDLTPKRAPQARLSGTYVTKLKGRGMEFDESRHYQPGDDIRAIDWRVTARTGKTHTKIYREERERPVTLLTDLSSTMQFGSQFVFKSVQAAHLASLIAWAAIDRGDKVGGISFNSQSHLELKPRSRQSAVLALTHQLITLQTANMVDDKQTSAQRSHLSSQRFLDACQRLRRLIKPGNLVWIVSDFHHLDAQSAALIADMNRHCEVRACVVADPMERALPSQRFRQTLNVTDGEHEQTITLGNAQLQKQYQRWANERHLHLATLLQQANVMAFTLDAGIPLLLQKLQPIHLSQLKVAS